VLILRDVLAMSAAEVAEVLEITVSSVNSLLHRARRTMRSGYSSSPTTTGSGSEVSLAVRRYIAAWEAGDVDALVRLLKTDALLEMPPLPSVSIGPAAIRAFLSPTILDGVAGRWRGIATRANGGPAVALYRRADAGYRFSGIQLLSAEDGRISSVTAYMEPDLAARFGLPGGLVA
jgi:RNA polymerase sigma-70 factor (ECF subfamily)